MDEIKQLPTTLEFMTGFCSWLKENGHRQIKGYFKNWNGGCCVLGGLNEYAINEGFDHRQLGLFTDEFLNWMSSVDYSALYEQLTGYDNLMKFSTLIPGCHITALNDNGMSFADIAALIEEYHPIFATKGAGVSDEDTAECLSQTAEYQV